jgi:hypothetical protein
MPQRFEKIAFNDKLLPALGSRFNFTETVLCPIVKRLLGRTVVFTKAPNV